MDCHTGWMGLFLDQNIRHALERWELALSCSFSKWLLEVAQCSSPHCLLWAAHPWEEERDGCLSTAGGNKGYINTRGVLETARVAPSHKHGQGWKSLQISSRCPVIFLSLHGPTSCYTPCICLSFSKWKVPSGSWSPNFVLWWRAKTLEESCMSNFLLLSCNSALILTVLHIECVNICF